MSSENENISQSDENKDTEEEPQLEEKSEDAEEEQVNLQQREQMEAAKLKAKYPMAFRPGGTALLQKRLNKGQQKYFDSGDYNMAKAKSQKQPRPVPAAAVVPPQQPTGEAIPTPDNLPTRKTSLVQSKLAAGLT